MGLLLNTIINRLTTLPKNMCAAKFTQTVSKISGRFGSVASKGHIFTLTQVHDTILDEETFRSDNRENDDAGRFFLVANSVLGHRLTHKDLTSKI